MIYNTLFQVLIYVIPFITAPYVSRVLGVEHVGQYSYALSIVTYFTIFATLGSSTHGQRIIAYNRDNPNQLNQEFWNTVFFRIITTTLSIIAYLIYLSLRKSVSLLEFIVILNTLNVAFDITWFFQGIEDFKQTVIRGLIVRLFGLAGVFIFVRSPDDTCKYAVILLGSQLLGSLSLWVRIPQLVGRPRYRIHPFSNFRDIFLVFLPTIASQVYLVLDKSMIGWITKSDYQNGCYDQSERLVRVILSLISSISTVVLPRVANLFVRDQIDQAKNYVYKSYRVVLLIAVPCFFGIVASAKILIPVYLGNGYELSVPLLQIFAWLLIVVSIASITGFAYLVPTKQQNVYTVSVALAALANLIMNLTLIPRIGAVGAAIASIIAETIGTTIQISYCVKKKQLELKKIFLPSWKYCLAGCIMFTLLLMVRNHVGTNILGFMLIFLIGVISYAGLLIIFRDSLFLYFLKKVKSKVTHK